MSNIYIQEPPTSGKVLLVTTVGDIDVELWSKECPRACRNFVQLCMEGYYNDTIFHRVVKGFIVQGGDPKGDGTGGESIYGEPFKDEFHSRLRYARRGLLGMANAGMDDNGSQFFFTLAEAKELENKHTLFGKVTGDTLFNMLKLEDGLVDHNEKPLYPQRIIRTKILNNPFPDIEPRISKKTSKEEQKNKKIEKGVKNFGLLSFGEEAEEDEEETNEFVQKNVGKAKSMHDAVEDPSLSKVAIKLERVTDDEVEEGAALLDDSCVLVKEEPETVEERMQRIKNKLQTVKTVTAKAKIEVDSDSENEHDELMTQDKEKQRQNDKKKQEIREEIQSLKKSYQTGKRRADFLLEKQSAAKDADSSKPVANDPVDNNMLKTFREEKEKYTNLKSKAPRKGSSREDFTLSLLKKFRTKLDTLKQMRETDAEVQPDDSVIDDATVEKEIQGDEWLTHKFRFQEAVPVLAKDASTKSDDWYDVYDPRNPLNKRRRGDKRSEKFDNDKDKHAKRIK